MSIKEQMPNYFLILESNVAPEEVKQKVRNFLTEVAGVVDALQNDKLLDVTTKEVEMVDSGEPSSSYVNQDPDLKKNEST